MKVTMTGRKVSLKPAFEERVNLRLAKLDRFFDQEAQAKVTVTVEKDRHTVEVTVQDKGFLARAEKTDDQMEKAFDDAADLLTRRLLKNRSRLQTKLHQPVPVLSPQEESEPEDGEYLVIREKTVILKPTTVEEAILEMNLLGHDFYMFQNADTHATEVVYRRKNGTYGVLISE